MIFHTKDKPMLLDLFCKAGGAAVGYSRAGFDVIGVDIEPQPNYPFKFIKGDAIVVLTEIGNSFDAIHASPPCQGYTRLKSLALARNNGQYGDHPMLIEETREALIKTGKPYVIENVKGTPLINPIKLYGSQFGLKTQRERWFETNVNMISQPSVKMAKMKTPSAGNGKGVDGSISICGSGGVRGMTAPEIIKYWSYALGGVDWMTRAEMAECIPPVYAEFIGLQLMASLLLRTNRKDD